MQEELEEQMGYGFANIKPDIQTLAKNEIFVFGSNLAGRHGKGAALKPLRGNLVQFMDKVLDFRANPMQFQQKTKDW